jgi:hypothetical protein
VVDEERLSHQAGASAPCRAPCSSSSQRLTPCRDREERARTRRSSARCSGWAIEAMSGLPEDVVVRSLHESVRRSLCAGRGSALAGQEEYAFNHMLARGRLRADPRPAAVRHVEAVARGCHAGADRVRGRRAPRAPLRGGARVHPGHGPLPKHGGAVGGGRLGADDGGGPGQTPGRGAGRRAVPACAGVPAAGRSGAATRAARVRRGGRGGRPRRRGGGRLRCGDRRIPRLRRPAGARRGSCEAGALGPGVQRRGPGAARGGDRPARDPTGRSRARPRLRADGRAPVRDRLQSGGDRVGGSGARAGRRRGS